MKSISTIFVWDKESRTVINKPLRMVDWVFEGKGTATRKWDGVAIKVENGHVFRRAEWRPGEPVPSGFIKFQDPDPKRPHASIPGWIPIDNRFLTKPQGVDEKALQEAWQDRLVQLTQAAWAKTDAAEAIKKAAGKQDVGIFDYAPTVDKYPYITEVPNGTYELCGPQIRGNHEGLAAHVLYKHGDRVVKGVPRTFEGLKKFLEAFEGEGIVWHYQMKGDSIPLMAKIKRRDFGFYTRLSKDEIAMAYGAKTENKSAEKEAATT